MIVKNIKFICAALVLVCANASATLITFETRDLNITQGHGVAANHGVDQNNFARSWSELNEGTSESFSGEFTRLKPGKDKFNHIKIDLSLDRDSTNWIFDFGVDAGFGMALYLDGTLIDSTNDDLWWKKKWTNSDVFSVTLNDLTRDNKVLDIYWAEHCCNGSSSIRFKNDTGQWSALSVANLDAASIPEPTSMALFGLGLLAFFSRGRMTK